MKALILSAGLGTRLKPLTVTIPKALVPVAGKPMIVHLLERLSKYGINEFIINLHHHADMLQTYLESLHMPGISIAFSDEREALLDTGGALKRAARCFSDGKPFLVHNVDVWTDLDPGALLRFHKRQGAMATLAVRHRTSSRYFLFDAAMELAGWENAASGTRLLSRPANKELVPLAFSGVQVINPDLFGYFPESGKFSLVDLYLNAAKEEKIIGFRHDEGVWSDLGTRDRIASIISNA
jgi:NDP-sugar pyrophosphorylase family protein